MTAWNRDADDILVRLWNEGWSAELVAAELGVSRSAVIGRLHRLRDKGWTLRGNDKPQRRQPRRAPAIPSQTQFIALWNAGISSAEIARSAGTSVASVLERAGRLRRQHPELGIAKRTGGNGPRFNSRPPASPGHRAAPAKIIAGDPLDRTMPLIELEPHQCKWPGAAIEQGPILFCGRPAIEGSSYCEAHHRRAYVEGSGR